MPKTIIIVLMYDFFVFARLEHRKMYFADFFIRVWVSHPQLFIINYSFYALSLPFAVCCAKI